MSDISNSTTNISIYDENGNAAGITSGGRLMVDSFATAVSANFFLAISKGEIDGHSVLTKFGQNRTVNAILQDLWDEGGIYQFPSSATIMSVSSSSANDTSAGTGARTVQIYGLDANYNEQTETISLNGLTGVNTTKSYLRIYRMIVRTAGTTENNDGNIYIGTGTITDGKPATVYGLIDIGYNQTLMAIYTVPAGKTGYLFRITMSSFSSQDSEVRLLVRPYGEVFQTKNSEQIKQLAFEHNFMPFKIEEKSDIKFSAKTKASTAEITATFQMVLVNN